MADPITCVQIYGYITSPIPDALKYPYDGISPSGSTFLGSKCWIGIPELYGLYQFRASAPMTSRSALTTATSFAVSPGDVQLNNGSLSFAYASGSTTITLQNPNVRLQFTLPYDLSQLSAGAGGSAKTYNVPDSQGQLLLTATQSAAGLVSLTLPGSVALVPLFPPALPPSGFTGVTQPPNIGSGTFSQTKGGQTLTGTWQLVGYSVTSLEGSQDAYFSTH